MWLWTLYQKEMMHNDNESKSFQSNEKEIYINVSHYRNITLSHVQQ